ncbi:hypothetical protein FRC17_001544 [Serendipita sp. 399]|nr:hypothetical protein FRC17_001544 [Serendipita sp. 399]
MSSAEDAKVVGINSLPAELLLKILTSLCLPSETGQRLRLIAVCSRWRQLLLATPTIWRRIHIDSSEWKSQDAYERFLLRLETQLIRSGSERLTVYFKIEQLGEETDSGLKPDLKPLARLIEQRAPFSAWKILNLQRCSQEMLNELQLDRMGGFINLEILLLQDLSDPLLPILSNTITDAFRSFEYLPDFYESDEAFVRSIPNSILSRIIRLRFPIIFLRSATSISLPPNILSVEMPSKIPDSIFPYVRFADLRPSYSDCLSTLPIRFPNLVLLNLTASTPHCSIPAFPSIEFPNLRYLTMGLFAYRLLGPLISPQLQTLTLSMQDLTTNEVPLHHLKKLELSEADLETNLRPEQTLLLFVPTPFHVLNAALRSAATKVKNLAVTFASRGDSLRALSTLFHWEREEECVEGPADNQLDDEITHEWNRCLGDHPEFGRCELFEWHGTVEKREE